MGLAVLAVAEPCTPRGKPLPSPPPPGRADDTIITWPEPALHTDVALSFQEAFTCSQVWAEIQRVQEAGLSPRSQTARMQGERPSGRESRAGMAVVTIVVADCGGEEGALLEIVPVAWVPRAFVRCDVCAWV